MSAGSVSEKYTMSGLMLLHIPTVQQWVIASSKGTNYNIPLPISLTHGGTVVGMDGSVPSISYAAMLSDTHTIKITTNIEGYWAFRAIIVGF